MKIWLEKGLLICIEDEVFHQPERKENNQNYHKVYSLTSTMNEFII